MTAKEIVKSFYDLDLAKAENAIDLVHKDCKLLWNSSNGFTSLDYDGIKNMLDGLRKAFLSFNYRVSHLLEDQNMITARYTIYVTSIERPEKEDALAHFISIWEVKDGKLYKGYEISQLADDSSESLNSYAEIKV
ncbi:nuclear transport factor 2 family protein [Psychroserpens luteolus]|uniref:nuclear transport factor 2 family protein n=1 Tax=Psychroserpens luteolus TaxID=2855840 RepID=UPI001E4F2CAB|nr:nuclear transport factor 2 family protein [Psychroserpens luteolus]MCD2258895.1 nuclear transport factor 2 family protein [Psychroserpens luteolus]